MTITMQERVWGLGQIWRDVPYHFARFSAEQAAGWDALYQAYLLRVAAEEDPLRYYALLCRFLNTLDDGHTYVRFPQALLPPYRVPFGTAFVDGRHVLSAVPQAQAGLLGAVILGVNGVPLPQYLAENVFPYVWSGGDRLTFAWGLLGYIIGCTEAFPLWIETDAGPLHVREAGADAPQASIPRPRVAEPMTRLCDEAPLKIDRTQDNLCVLHIPHFGDAALRDVLYRQAPRYRDCAGFLIDVCGNEGGSSDNGDAVAALFFDGPVPDGMYQTPVYRAHAAARVSLFGKAAPPARALETEQEEKAWPAAPVRLRQPVVVLSDGATASAAESFLIAMRHQGRARVVGERSAGTNGQPLFGDLPGGGRYAICTQRCLTNDGEDYDRCGLRPDVEVCTTLADYRSGRDPIFSEGLRQLRRLVSARAGGCIL